MNHNVQSSPLPKQTEPVQDAIKLIIEEQSLGLARGPKFDNALTVVCHAVLQQSAELERLKAAVDTKVKYLKSEIEDWAAIDVACDKAGCPDSFDGNYSKADTEERVRWLAEQRNRLQRLCDESAAWIERVKGIHDHLSMIAANTSDIDLQRRCFNMMAELDDTPSHSLLTYRKQVIEELAEYFKAKVGQYPKDADEWWACQFAEDELRRRASLPADKIERKG